MSREYCLKHRDHIDQQLFPATVFSKGLLNWCTYYNCRPSLVSLPYLNLCLRPPVTAAQRLWISQADDTARIPAKTVSAGGTHCLFNQAKENSRTFRLLFQNIEFLPWKHSSKLSQCEKKYNHNLHFLSQLTIWISQIISFIKSSLTQRIPTTLMYMNLLPTDRGRTPTWISWTELASSMKGSEGSNCSNKYKNI